MFLWVARPTVVIGRNQNPWLECDVAFNQKQDVCFARRVTGGGAVYHDAGNLNVSLILPRSSYREENISRLFIKALAKLGGHATRTGRTGLAVDGRKISGIAFSYRKNRVLHHATLLVESDLERLRLCLRPSALDLTTRSVASRPAKVCNFTDVAGGITMEDAMEAMTNVFSAAWGGHDDLCWESSVAQAEIKTRAEILAGVEWRFDKSPRFSARFHSGDATAIALEVDRGTVQSVEKGNNTPRYQRLVNELPGQSFRPHQWGSLMGDDEAWLGWCARFGVVGDAVSEHC